MGVVALTVVSLYVSSLCTSGLRALLMLVPAMFGVGIVVSRVAESLVSSGRILFLWSAPVWMVARTSSEKAW